MKSFLPASILLVVFLCPVLVNAQPSDDPILNSKWTAQWIAVPDYPGDAYGVFYFRKSIELQNRPGSFLVHVSADNRYKLYVNGNLVSLGPARGDIYHWNYETVDLSPYLVKGRNIIASLVWNEAAFRPEAQITVRTGFILQGHTAAEEIINTNSTWKGYRDASYQPLRGIFVASSGELVHMNPSVKNWTAVTFDDSAWPAASQLDNGHPKGSSDGFGWMLVPSAIPQMELKYERIPVLRKVTGMQTPDGFPATKKPITIPADTTVTMLLDQTHLTSAYLTLNFSAGKNAGISLNYAESLFDNLKTSGTRKSNRNEVEGKDFLGRKDSLVSDGSNGQTYTTLYWRTFRYIMLTVHTANEPLVIDDIYGTFTGYPFQQNAKLFNASNEMNQMLDIGWRTARLNAVETYMDCPYYEQLQYIGDTRIQAMVSYYNSGDDRLARNAINLMDHSRLPEGVTLSRYPTHSTQVISTFSLWYIGMLHDYWMYRPDKDFIKNKLTGARAILDFFSTYQQADGSLKNTPYWTFVDWTGDDTWFFGSPLKGKDGGIAILDLQLLWAYQWAAEMESKLGMKDFADLYVARAAKLKSTIQRKYWDPVKKLYAETADRKSFSQHTNSLAVLTGMVEGAGLTALCNKLVTDKDLIQCTIYFKYYLHQALVKGGLGNQYMDWLDIWRNNIRMGLTTWAEESNLSTTRSDCHAWGSSPNIEFYRTVLGIDTYSPGFATVRIEPHPGSMTDIGGEMPHPNGKVRVSYKLEKNKWKISVELPSATPGFLIWKGKRYPLQPGKNQFTI